MSLLLGISEAASPGLFSSLPPGIVEGAGLFLTRCGALLLAAPLLGSGAQFHGYKVAMVGSITAVLFVAQGFPVVETTSAVHLAILALREMAIGLALSFVLHLTVMGLRVGSELVGNEMAFSMASAVDPASGESLPLISRMNETLFMLALLAVDGHQWLIRALAESFERAPVGIISMDTALPQLVATLFNDLFVAGIAFAAPTLIMLMMVSVVIGLIARAVPQVNVLEMGFSLRVGGGLIAMCLLSPTLSAAMGTLLDYLMAGLEAGLDAIEV